MKNKILKITALSFTLCFNSFKVPDAKRIDAVLTSYYTPMITCQLNRTKGYEQFGMGPLKDVYVKYSEEADATLKREGIVAIQYPNKQIIFVRYERGRRMIENSPVGVKKTPLRAFESAAGAAKYFGKSILFAQNEYKIVDTGEAFSDENNKFDLYVGIMSTKEYKRNHCFRVVKKITLTNF